MRIDVSLLIRRKAVGFSYSTWKDLRGGIATVPGHDVLQVVAGVNSLVNS